MKSNDRTPRNPDNIRASGEPAAVHQTRCAALPRRGDDLGAGLLRRQDVDLPDVGRANEEL
jgi:hypothetical protein